MPMTPWCHAALARTMLSTLCARSSSATQASKMASSTLCRFRFSSQRSKAYCKAASRLSVKMSSTAIPASPIRPAALMRGARQNPTVVELTVRRFVPASSIRESSPARLLSRRDCSPRYTSVRFSPSRSITSATVPTAARSAYSSKISRRRATPASAITSFRATPTPAKSLKG